MSLNGTQPVKLALVGSHAVLSPSACKTPWARPTQPAAGDDRNAAAIAGFNPDGRKKFVSAAGTYGCPLGLAPHGANTVGSAVPTNSGLLGKLGLPGIMFCASAAAIAACQFLTSKSPRTVFALIGRLRWWPPLKLYATLSAKSCPRA